MRFYREDYSLRLVSEIFPLLSQHHEETMDDFYGPLNPNLQVYSEADQRGILRIFTVRNFDGQHLNLVGYQIFFVSPHHHSQERIVASQDILYVHPSARRGMVAYRFIQWCNEKLKMEGIHIVHQRISARHDFGRLLERMGYRLEDLTYSKKLQEEI